VVYAETRFAPHFHTAAGLGLDAVMAAVLGGLARGERDFGVATGLIVCALRNEEPPHSLAMAELAVAFRNRGCVGFDLAGEEAGHPAKHHIDAFHFVQRQNFSITIHAGESFGPESIWQALQYCGAHRIGHGTRLIEDMVLHEGRVVHLGPLAQYVLDKRIPIECCLSSNEHTGAVKRGARHPIHTFLEAGVPIAICCDNTTVSRTNQVKESARAAAAIGLDAVERIHRDADAFSFIKPETALQEGDD